MANLRTYTVRVLFAALLVVFTNCSPDSESVQSDPSADTAARVEPGAAVLFRDGASILAGKRVGAIVNHTARVGAVHLIDALADADVEVSVIFSPEHGFRGNEDAGAKVGNSVDEQTGIPIFSLYGQNRAPTLESLADVDILLFDIQDVGARFYTYISTLGLSMQAAATAGIPFVVLDRPNPIGGDYVSGFVLEPEFQSYVGMYPIPVAHGMTVGELANMIVGESLLPGLDALELTVVPIDGWSRSMRWPETGLEWIAPSPNLPSIETALVYAGTCFIEATIASEGRGTLTPFKRIGAPWINGEQLADELSKAGLNGVEFESVHFTPISIEGMSTNPKLKDVEVSGVDINVTDHQVLDPLAVGIAVLVALRKQAEATGQDDFIRKSGLRRLAGTERLAEMLEAGATAAEISESWSDEITAFKELRAPYLLYK